MKTIDGGITWTSIFTGNPDQIRNLFVLDENTIFACGGAEQINGKIWKSIDSGENWLQIGNSYPDAIIGGLYFLNSDTGVLGVYESVFGNNPTSTTWLSTIDGSNSFTSDVVPNSISYWNFSTDFPTASTGFSTSSKYSDDVVYLRKSMDGGTSWVQNPIPNYMGSIYSLDFIDDQLGYLLGGTFTEASILKTIDGGVSWISEMSPNTNTLHSVYFNNSTIGYAVGDNGTILKRTETTSLASDLNTNFEVVVYPNPSKNQINISFPNFEKDITSINFIDFTGNDIMAVKIDNNPVDVSRLPVGVYCIKFYNQNIFVGHIKFIKQ